MFVIYFTIAVVFITNATGSALHGSCEKNDHCGTIDTYCSNGTCVCHENFAVFLDTCIELATPKIPCKHKSECHRILGKGSTCKDGYCTCKSFHHIHYNQINKTGICIKNRGLDDVCDFDHQCYLGQDYNNNIGCIQKICNCKAGTERIKRRCISVLSTNEDESININNDNSNDIMNSTAKNKFSLFLVLIVLLNTKKL